MNQEWFETLVVLPTLADVVDVMAVTFGRRDCREQLFNYVSMMLER